MVWIEPWCYLIPLRWPTKKLPPLAPEAVQAAFGPRVEVFTDAAELRAVLERDAPDELNLLIMSSGNLGGWDVRQWAPTFVSN